MGQKVDKEWFSEEEYRRFAERLDRSLTALRELLARPGFGAGPESLGAELELFVVTPDGYPLPRNEEIRAAAGDDRVVLELGRFNLEVNLTPVPMTGTPMSTLAKEIGEAIRMVDGVAREHGGGVVPIGILPTLAESDFGRDTMSDEVRYRALSRGMRRLRLEPFTIRIEGRETLELQVEDVILESANTSWQVHLRSQPERFDELFNAAQLATGPVLAVAGNSPSFFGRNLWEETRIALFEAAADDRDIERLYRREGRVAFGSGWVRGGTAELFERCVRHYEPVLPVSGEEDPLAVVRAGGVPRLDELRLHQGTVWQWNRPVFDPDEGGHLRVELRALPAGPTPVDMAANTAFLVGLVLALAADTGWTDGFPFANAYRNFYRGARNGLDAMLSWPGRDGEVPAGELALDLIPLAAAGLESSGVDREEACTALEVIRKRVERRRTGAIWQREAVAALGRDRRSVARMVTRYRELSLSGEPVHNWPDMSE